MHKPIRILLQTTIPPITDEWHIGRFSLLRDYLASLTDENGEPLAEVTARDRGLPGNPDPVLSTLDRADFDELWLFAVDSGDGLHPADYEGICRFRQGGGALLVTRDPTHLGSSLRLLGSVGEAHHFRSHDLEREDTGANGGFQEVTLVGDPHELFADPDTGGNLHYLPAPPQEGAVEAPPDDSSAHVIATGCSATTGHSVNLVVAFEPVGNEGRAVAQSSIHHFADDNWDPTIAAPSSAPKPAGDGIEDLLAGRRSTERYVHNLALWLARRPVDLEKWRLDQRLDEALKETFPGSDPIAVTPVDRPPRPS